MNIYEANMKPIKAIREAYDVEVIGPDGARSPFNTPCATLTDAREQAAKMARAGGVTVFELTFRQDIKSMTAPGVYVCPIRNDMGLPGWPRVFS